MADTMTGDGGSAACRLVHWLMGRPLPRFRFWLVRSQLRGIVQARDGPRAHARAVLGGPATWCGMGSSGGLIVESLAYLLAFGVQLFRS